MNIKIKRAKVQNAEKIVIAKTNGFKDEFTYFYMKSEVLI